MIIEILSTEERHALLASMVPKNESPERAFKQLRNRTMVMVMLETGLRVSELCGLAASDLYFAEKPVLQLVVRPEIAKNKSERTIPVSTLLSVTLAEWWRCAKPAYLTNPIAPAFQTLPNGHRITPRQVERIVRAVGIQVIGRDIHPHILRHTFATRLMRITNARVVQELLGHKHLTTTQIYTHPNSTDLRQAVNKIEDVTAI
jgi:site-specific recombinase XerD